MRLWALVLVAHLFCFNPRICKRCDSSNKEINVDARGFNPRICKRCDFWALVLVARLFCFNPRICKRCDHANAVPYSD